MTRIVAPSRLHFGLLQVPCADASAIGVRSFGGIGLMINQPGLALHVEAADDWSANGPLADRALRFAQDFMATLPQRGKPCYQLQIEYAPREHSGLGVGTSLGLAVAKALALETGHGDWSILELAKRVGRGTRSAVGVHGFDGGGFIVEAGKLPHEPISPLLGRYLFPEHWCIGLVYPDLPNDWYGHREQQAFRNVQPQPTAEMCRQVLTAIVPAMIAQNFAEFSSALEAYNTLAGAAFIPSQGGIYSHPILQDTILRLRQHGMKGVGQSSWGPTLFGFWEDLGQARSSIELLHRSGIMVNLAHSSQGYLHSD